MKLQAKYGLTLTMVLVLILLFFIAPTLSKQSILEGLDGWFGESEQHSDDADEAGDETDHQKVTPAEPLTVTFNEQALDYIGVETTMLKPASFTPELKTHAYAVDLTDLVSWQSRFQQAQAALTVAKVTEQSALQELERLQRLEKAAGSIASKNISYAESTWKEKSAQRQAAQIDLDNIETELTQAWGTTIATWVENSHQEQFQSLLNRKQVLLLLSMPVGISLPVNDSEVHVSALGDRSKAQPASYVSSAYPHTSAIQSETYYFLSSDEHLRPGMRVDAWVTQSKHRQQGFYIPEAAIVWYAGQPWAYIEVERGTYKRKALVSGRADEHGIFMQSEFNEGDALVVAGSQMLLSEEFRWQIHDEDDD